jgi:hypothetical protein
VDSCLVQLWQTDKVARCARSSSTAESVKTKQPAYLCTLSLGCPSEPLSQFRSACAASALYMRNGSEGVDQEGKLAYLVGSTELERERVHHFLNLQLCPVSGSESAKWEKLNYYSTFPSLFGG